jgi:hypothetical protein
MVVSFPHSFILLMLMVLFMGVVLLVMLLLVVLVGLMLLTSIVALGVVTSILWLCLVGLLLLGVSSIGCLRRLGALKLGNLILSLAQSDLKTLLCAHNVFIALGKALDFFSQLNNFLLALSDLLFELSDSSF